MRVTIATLKRLIIAGGLPKENYPPANIKSMIDQCNAKGREDLGQKIMDQWNDLIGRSPKLRVNWAAASAYGNNSIKKHVFNGLVFAEWFAQQVALSPEEKKEAVKSAKPEKIAAPKIAIPAADETLGDWEAEAAKTKVMLNEASENFATVENFVAYLQEEITTLKRRLSDYGEGGSKHLTKTGVPHAYVSRIPKWEAQLEAYSAKLTEVTEVKTKFEKAKNSYEHAPVTTVEYEQEVQDSLSNVLTFILDIKDLKKQEELLQKFDKSLDEIKKNKLAAAVNKIEVNADLWDFITDLFDSFGKIWKTITNWFKGLFNAVDDFDDLASIRY